MGEILAQLLIFGEHSSHGNNSNKSIHNKEFLASHNIEINILNVFMKGIQTAREH
jgi:hypothetical protein